MFKLIVIQDKQSDPIYVNTLNDYYSEAVLYDITPFVSTNSIDIDRGKLLNEISFKYEDPQTILNKEFKENNLIAYGDNEVTLYEIPGDPTSPKLDGSKEEIKLPFEMVLPERISDVNTDTQTNIQLASIIDDKFEPVNIKPYIHYSYSLYQLADNYKFKKNNDSFKVANSVIMPFVTQGNLDNPANSLVFDREFNPYTNQAIENTLYTNYHESYISSIFNIKKRQTKLEAKLPLRIILNLKLKDVLKFKENYYRINNWTYNLLTGICKLDLINSFDNTINGFNASRTTIDTDGTAKTESIFFTNCTDFIFDYVDSWILNVTNTGNNVYFEIDANDTGFIRTALIDVTNAQTLQTIQITINQNTTL